MRESPQFSPTSSVASVTISPPPEHGVNLWILSTARRCELAGYSQTQAFESIMSFCGQLRPGRTISQQEVARAISTAYATPHKAGDCAPKVTSLSARELAKLCPPISEKAAQAFVASSPLDRTAPTAQILATLYGPDEFLAFKSINQCRAEKCRVKDLPDFFDRADRTIQFVTSSSVTGQLGKTQDHKFSHVAKECFTAQRFVVIEFDSASPQEQFARILFLKERLGDHAPMVMMLKSGGKSFHAWFIPTSTDMADQLKQAGVKLGADPAAMRIHQPVRCPNQYRDNGNLQEVLWLSHPPITTPIS